MRKKMPESLSIKEAMDYLDRVVKHWHKFTSTHKLLALSTETVLQYIKEDINIKKEN